MTFKEKLAIEHPEKIDDICFGGCQECPSSYKYEPTKSGCIPSRLTCEKCWNREIPDNVGEIAYGTIKDSGDRTEFASGAVRDMHEGKGRCDLLPLDVISEWLVDDKVLECIYDFTIYGAIQYLFGALNYFRLVRDWDIHTLILEVAKHFEEGAKKYGDNNWRKGIPVRCYIDSAVRHYLKYLRGDKDEPHDRAFCWNILCCIWTCKHKPEWNDYAKKGESE